MAKFTVDTHLFRELGELLVGRDSTALVELIKNSYDADATEVMVYGQSLCDPKLGYITITDDGLGMTEDQFVNGFLRIASRLKEEGPRLSKRFGRRFTGAKGIGRLAAHKLAHLIQIHSIPFEEQATNERKAVDAIIDWDAIEKQPTLDDLGNDAVILDTLPVSKNARNGTQIKLERLRRKWTPVERTRFLSEVETFEPPSALISIPRGVLTKRLLFDEPKIRESSNRDPGFKIKLEGDFEVGEDYWQNLAQAASWIIEIDATNEGANGKGVVHYTIAPTVRTAKQNPYATRRDFQVDHPEPDSGPFFQSRILVREGSEGSKQFRTWMGRSSGIRVFMEGFRVLPYGEPHDDWLVIDADYTRRSRTLRFLDNGALSEHFEGEAKDIDAALVFLRNTSYFGAVFLTQAQASNLRMLVNREGFVPEAGYHTLVNVVRMGIDLSVRVRAAATYQSRQERREQRRSGKQDTHLDENMPALISSTQALKQAITHAREVVSESRQLAAKGDIGAATTRFTEAANDLDHLFSQAQAKLISEEAMLRVLASVGTQMAGFIHEINGLIGMAEAVDKVLGRIRGEELSPNQTKQELAKLHSAIGDLRRSLGRQAAYLVDVVTPDARRRRVRMSLSSRFDTGFRLVEHQASRRAITIANNIPGDLKSPPMFPAELTTVFSNLLTNSVKAAGQGGRIRATAETRSDDSIVLLIENTGAAVDLSDSERWFRPFESTTESIDPVLGQGMGMGLPITRSMLEEYGATIKFVRPNKGYATAVQVVFPP